MLPKHARSGLGMGVSIVYVTPIVYRLKSGGALEMKFVASVPEQIATTTMHFLKDTSYV